MSHTWAPWPGCSRCDGTGKVDAGGLVADCPACAMRALWVAAAADRDRWRERAEDAVAVLRWMDDEQRTADDPCLFCGAELGHAPACRLAKCLEVRS